MAGVVIAVGGWAILHSRGPSTTSSESPTAGSGVPIAVAGSDESPEEPQPNQPPPASGQPDGRWLPEQTRLVFSLRLSQLANRAEFDPAVAAAQAVWARSVGRLVDSFGLRLAAVERFSWASTDLSDWADSAVVVVHLGEGQDARVFRPIGEAVDIELQGIACRRLPDRAWSHPYAVLDERTIVTGREDLLRRLADRSDPALASVPLDRFLRVADPTSEILAAVDLAAAREAGWKLPAGWLDVWPAAATAWHVAWEMPCGLGLTWRGGDRDLAQLAWICDGPTAAEEVHQALDALAEAASGGIQVATESLTARVENGRMTAEAANRYESLLKETSAILKTAQSTTIDETVWVRIEGEPGLASLAARALDSQVEIRAEWLAAARSADEQNHRRLLSGLSAHEQAEGNLPPGAGGGTLLPPETRLSWIAAMLPYYGHRDWHRQLDPGYPWNGPQNRPVTRQRLDAVVNPAFGPTTTAAGFPVTHYVGVAGIGPDAGNLDRGDPRAGMFGFAQSTRREEIRDGASNTLATLGVSDHLGAWASGGPSTVRALTEKPYVNGPDGFGSGQPDGMTAGMADGSVRFLSAATDPLVLEQLATIAGSEKTSATVLTPAPGMDGEDRPPKPIEPTPETGPPESERAGLEQTAAVPPDATGQPVDVEARLAQTVVEIELPSVPLAEAVELVAQLGGIKITLDTETMARLNVDRQDQVTFRRSASSLGEILEAILAERGLVYLIQNEQVWVTGPEEKRIALYPRPYTVSDLADREPAGLAAMASLVVQLVAPESWKGAGGRGTIRLGQGVLEVVQTDAVHHELVEFCEKLRLARGLPLLSRGAADRFTLTTHLGEAAKILGRPISLNFQQGAPLVRIVADLEEAGQVDLLVNWMLLVDAGVRPQTQGTLVVHERPLAEALSQLLEPLGLAYRIVDPGTLEITTRKAAAARLELEFFKVGPLIASGIPAQSLIEPIQDRLAPATWNDAGGPAVIHFDEPSQTLIVLQSQPVQVEIERLLAALAEEMDQRAKPAGN
jgi:hypothetical protein